ncbi:hypothetical protein RJ640_000713 [Escallonia rubra]|uniref:GRAM domain-containing protein n=1 Tax=Escallonia rubra TaxID=112253 RepID=A0AA88UT76_9ASTE|nr:hypothetical protein RJ640_000713 [Escallonia rubra]
MAVPSATAEKIEQPQMADQPPPPRLSDASAVSPEPPSSSPPPPSGADPPDHTATPDQPNSTPSPSRQPEIQVLYRHCNVNLCGYDIPSNVALRYKTGIGVARIDALPSQSQNNPPYRSGVDDVGGRTFQVTYVQVLIEDFNCALQDNFLFQGHMYLFLHYICFYGNIFGFEAKKVIPFQEVTSVRRAKAAGLFPTAIEVIAAGKKYFFTSFLSRDEAFKLINDGWLQHGNEVKDNLDEQVLKEVKAITDPQVTQVNDVTELHQGLSSESNSQENGMAIVERGESFRQPVDELDLAERNKDASASEDSESGPVGETEVVSTSSGRQVIVDGDTEVALNSECSSSGNSLVWEAEDSDAPEEGRERKQSIEKRQARPPATSSSEHRQPVPEVDIEALSGGDEHRRRRLGLLMERRRQEE